MIPMSRAKGPKSCSRAAGTPFYGANNCKFWLAHWLFFQIREQKEHIRCAQLMAGASLILARRVITLRLLLLR